MEVVYRDMFSPNPFQTTTNIQIRLVRDDSDSSKDDRIAIKYKGEEMYQLFYMMADTSDKKPIINFTVLDGNELDSYLQSLFTLISQDRIPFKGIEFMIPCFPSIRYQVEDLTKENIQNALFQVMPLLRSAIRC